MKQIIEDISILRKDGAFKDEQHARFSLAGRVCQTQGGNILNLGKDLIVAIEYTDKRKA